jgi:hypothetical protein
MYSISNHVCDRKIYDILHSEHHDVVITNAKAVISDSNISIHLVILSLLGSLGHLQDVSLIGLFHGRS